MESRSLSAMRGAVAALAVGALLAGCEGKKNETMAGRDAPATQAGSQTATQTSPAADAQRIASATFDVDPALLGFTYEDSTLWLRFAPPRGWPPVEAELLDQTQQALSEMPISEDRFVSKPVRIFYEKEKGYFMILSEFPKWPVGLDPLATMPQYLQRVIRQDPDALVTDRLYRHGNLVFYEMTVLNPVAVDLRLIVIRDNRLPVKVNFLVPRVDYDALNKAIEASIGSISAL